MENGFFISFNFIKSLLFFKQRLNLNELTVSILRRGKMSYFRFPLTNTSQLAQSSRKFYMNFKTYLNNHSKLIHATSQQFQISF